MRDREHGSQPLMLSDAWPSDALKQLLAEEPLDKYLTHTHTHTRARSSCGGSIENEKSNREVHDRI